MESYHHGDLRQAVLDAAVQTIEENGVGSINLRDLARTVGVSHAAPAHHFGDKAGLMTAIAAEGFDLLAEGMEASAGRSDALIESGVAYVRFAVGHPAHFAVMFRPELYRPDDPSVLAAEGRSRAALRGAVGSIGPEHRGLDPLGTTVAAWSFVHGFATLWLQGVLPDEIGVDPESAVRASASVLFGARDS